MFLFSLITLVAFIVACASGYWQVRADATGSSRGQVLHAAGQYCLVIEQTIILRGALDGHLTHHQSWPA